MAAVLSVLVGLVVVVAITAVTGYFVAQEFAYMAVDRSRLGALSASGDAAAARALKVTKRTSFMLSGAQLGITVTGLLVGYVAEPLIGTALAEMLGWASVPSGVGIAVGTVLALLVSTIVQMLFGELVPKNLAIARAEPVAKALSMSTLIYLTAFGWLVWVFDQASNLLLRALGIEPVHDVEHSATPRDLEHIVAESRESGELPDDLSVLLDRILDFPAQDAEHAMIPRPRVDVVRETDLIDRVRERMASGHSRYPVLDTEGDVVGVVHLEDVLATRDPDQVTAGTIARDVLVVPTVMPLPDVLRELSAAGDKLACVVDEYGGLAGIVTVEDLAEELVGEITDEHDPLEPDAPVLDDDGKWVMSGDTHIDEVERAVGRDLPQGDYETIAGLVLSRLGTLPDVGAVVDVDLGPDPADLLTDEAAGGRLRVEVVEVRRRVPSLVRVRLAEGRDPPDGADGADRAEAPDAPDAPDGAGR
ncbi:MAG TPA: hemolysin family protein [Intrasporangium sp.]|uniref:hemolysin family protein n=1 Tax=Intrasporangium sp. TaxID=1925024 RepID=UPI002B4605DA|nr:hemolysin family protein [Intrasporangium sp.]HKX66818.1 hemolysin family protein [Intrasporangium sp.]